MKCRLTYIIGAAGFPWFLLRKTMALIVVMVLVIAAELTTVVATTTAATTLFQLETEKTHSSSTAGSPQRHGRALLAFFAPAPLHPASKDRV